MTERTVAKESLRQHSIAGRQPDFNHLSSTTAENDDDV